MALIHALAARTGRPVDLIDLHTVGQPLLGQIVRHGRRVLGSASAHSQLISRRQTTQPVVCLAGIGTYHYGQRNPFSGRPRA